MFSLEAEPKILSVPGYVIRTAMEEYIKQAKLALASYRVAITRKLAGVDWECLIYDLESEIRAFEWTLPIVADGPHVMSITQWITVRNKLVHARTADEYLEAKKKREEHIAAHTPTSGAVS